MHGSALQIILKFSKFQSHWNSKKVISDHPFKRISLEKIELFFTWFERGVSENYMDYLYESEQIGLVADVDMALYISTLKEFDEPVLIL